MSAPLPHHVIDFDRAELQDLKRVPDKSYSDGFSYTFTYRGVAFGPACFGDWTMSTDGGHPFSIRIGWWELARLYLEREHAARSDQELLELAMGGDLRAMTAYIERAPTPGERRRRKDLTFSARWRTTAADVKRIITEGE